MSIQHRFDFGGVDIKAAADNQVLGSADDKQISIFQTRQVAGIEPSFFVDSGCRFLRGAIIALHHIRARLPIVPQLLPPAPLRDPAPTNLISTPGNGGPIEVSLRGASTRVCAIVGRTFRDAVAVVQRHAEKTFRPDFG